MYIYIYIYIYIYRGVGTGGSGVSDPPPPPPPPFKNMGGAKYVLPPHEMCINKLYIYILNLVYCLC